MNETFWSLITNVPHLEFEIFLTIIQDVVIGLLIWPTIKRFVRRQHLTLDEEHGVEHHE